MIEVMDSSADRDRGKKLPRYAKAGVAEVWLVDLACGRIGFLSPRALDVGREFTLSLPVMDAAPMSLLCRVLHCQAAANGAYTVGARFVRELAEAQPPAQQPA